MLAQMRTLLAFADSSDSRRKPRTYFTGDRAATRQGDILNRFPRCFYQGIQQEYAWMPKGYLTYAEKWQHEQT